MTNPNRDAKNPAYTRLLWATLAVVILGAVALAGVFVGRLYSEKGMAIEAVKKVALDYTLQFQQKPIRIGQLLKTEKSLVIFWATWCEPCVDEIKSLDKIIPALKAKGYELVFINYDGEKNMKDAEALARESQIESAYDLSGDLLYSVGVTSLPTSLVVDKSGKILKFILGQIQEDEL